MLIYIQQIAVAAIKFVITAVVMFAVLLFIIHWRTSRKNLKAGSKVKNIDVVSNDSNQVTATKKIAKRLPFKKKKPVENISPTKESINKANAVKSPSTKSKGKFAKNEKIFDESSKNVNTQAIKPSDKFVICQTTTINDNDKLPVVSEDSKVQYTSTESAKQIESVSSQSKTEFEAARASASEKKPDVTVKQISLPSNENAGENSKQSKATTKSCESNKKSKDSKKNCGKVKPVTNSESKSSSAQSSTEISKDIGSDDSSAFDLESSFKIVSKSKKSSKDISVGSSVSAESVQNTSQAPCASSTGINQLCHFDISENTVGNLKAIHSSKQDETKLAESTKKQSVDEEISAFSQNKSATTSDIPEDVIQTVWQKNPTSSDDSDYTLLGSSSDRKKKLNKKSQGDQTKNDSVNNSSQSNMEIKGSAEAHLNGDSKTINSTIDTAGERVRALEFQLSECQKKNNRELQNLNQLLSNKTSEFDVLQSKYNQIVKGKSGEMVTLKENLTREHSVSLQLRAQVDRLTALVKESSVHVAELENQNSELQRTKNVMDGMLKERAVSTNRSQEALIQQLNADLERSNGEMSQAHVRANSVNKELDQLKVTFRAKMEELQETRKLLEDQKESILKLQQTVRDQTHTENELRHQITAFQQQNTLERRHKSDLEIQLSQVHVELARLQSSDIKYQQELKRKDEQICRLDELLNQRVEFRAANKIADEDGSFKSMNPVYNGVYSPGELLFLDSNSSPVGNADDLSREEQLCERIVETIVSQSNEFGPDVGRDSNNFILNERLCDDVVKDILSESSLNEPGVGKADSGVSDGELLCEGIVEAAVSQSLPTEPEGCPVHKGDLSSKDQFCESDVKTTVPECSPNSRETSPTSTDRVEKQQVFESVVEPVAIHSLPNDDNVAIAQEVEIEPIKQGKNETDAQPRDGNITESTRQDCITAETVNCKSDNTANNDDNNCNDDNCYSNDSDINDNSSLNALLENGFSMHSNTGTNDTAPD